VRLKTITAASHSAAMAKVRATLGDDAVIVTTQDLPEGGVRVTAAIDHDDLDLADLLSPAAAAGEPAWFKGLAEHHELPAPLRRRLQEAIAGLLEGDPATVLSHALHSLFRFRPLPDASVTPLLLTGPPGVGKTASTAKLAARAVLAGRSVAVITTDVGRAGGLEQLTTLLAPLRSTPRAADGVTALKHAVAEAEADLVLIDTPGLNPFKPGDLGRISGLIEASGAEPVPVLAAGQGVADCADIAETYGALGASRMLATKLDATRRLGGVLAAAASGLALAEGGIGPTIGRGLSPLSAAGLARLLLHAQSSATAAGERKAGRGGERGGGGR